MKMGVDIFEFLQDLKYADIPQSARHHAKRCLLDLIGVAAAGSMLPLSEIVNNHVCEHFASGGAKAYLMFDQRMVSPVGSAMANGMRIDGFDAHDGHPMTKGHAGCGALAGLLSFAGDGSDISGAQFLSHLVVGYEVGVRAGQALHASVPDFHTSGAWVALSVAAIGARILGLDRQTSAHALGISEYHGPRSQMMRCIDHPTMVKDGSGFGAMAGVSAAYLARDGFSGAPAISIMGDDVAHFWNDFGTRWAMNEQYLKAYPVCRWAQPAVEAGVQLTRDHIFDVDDIEAIRVDSFFEATKLATFHPQTTEQAQYSLPFPLAAFLMHGRLGAAQISGAGLYDEKVRNLSARIELINDEEFSSLFPAQRWARVEVKLCDGRVFISKPAVARGSAENPLSDDEVFAKYFQLMSEAGLGERASAIKDLVWNLEHLDDVRPLFALIYGAKEEG